MSSKASQPSKQSSLLGFFKKATPAAAAGVSAPRPKATPSTPITPSTSHASSSSASRRSDGIDNNNDDDDNGILSSTSRKALKNGPLLPSSSKLTAIDLSSDGGLIEHEQEEEQEAAERQLPPRDPRQNGTTIAINNTASAATARLSTSTSDANALPPPSSSSSTSVSTKKQHISVRMPTPPLTSDGEGLSTSEADNDSGMAVDNIDDDDDEEEEDSIRAGSFKRAAKSRAAKRQIILSDGEDEDEADESEETGESSDVPPKKKSKASTTKKSQNATSNRKDSPFSLDDEDSDDYSDGGIDWNEVVSEMDEAKPQVKKKESKPATKAKAATAPPKRPAAPSKKSGSNNLLLTSADLARQERQTNYANEGEIFDFIKPEHRKDSSGNRPDDPDFDPRTLKIPGKDAAKFTPFEKQFWDIKKNHMDTVLFFQKGKFYELYENDADIAHQLFDLKLTGRVKMRMCGVPEASIDYWTAKFLAQGFKVGRVDQAETAIGADLRRQDGKGKGKAANEPKIVNRELRTVLTTGTIVDGQLLTDELSDHCIAIKEYIADGSSDPKFGIVIADCSTAEFTMSAFQDDTCRTRLETTIRQHKPRELICEKGNLSVPTLRLLRACVGPACTWNNLKAGTEFLSAEDAREGIEDLFNATAKEDDMDEGNGDQVPEQIRKLYGVAEAMSALGGMLWYLKGLNLDKDLVSVKNFNIFDPIRDGQSLILDGQTLAHIEVLQNSSGTDEGTLFKLLCRCTTPFGKRLFKIWVCQPLRSARAINDRLDAVEDIMNTQAFQDTFDRHTKNMPDIERLLSRIHAKSCRVRDFLKVLDAFQAASSMFDKLLDAASEFQSSGIPEVIRRAPELDTRVAEIRAMFKVDNDEIKPVKGKDAEFDVIAKRVKRIESDLEEQLEEYQKELRCRDIKFKDIGTKDIYQIECPVKLKVPKNWTKVSGTQSVQRYYSKEVEKLVQDLKEARERQDQAVKLFQYKVYHEFSKDYAAWLATVKLIAELDCLVSLAKASSAMGEPSVRPEIVEESQASVQFEELRHPCIFSASADFIPNSISLGGKHKNMVLLTGPNMAGKSTLLRMTCVGVILAQIGCYVPATSARISPCDRIVSRMGAADNMLAGQSTFRVEMEDCKKILAESTQKTLVILDELGRGTSTFDGLSIAYAVLHQLAGHLGCVGFFATHFTSLVDDFRQHPEISLKHLKTFVDEETREVTFLYRLTDGSSPKSYGPHVASMAGVPRNVVERAIAVSRLFEERTMRHEANKRKDQALPLDLQADAAFLLKLASKDAVPADSRIVGALDIIRRKMTTRTITV